jgi:hypothetical protein
MFACSLAEMVNAGADHLSNPDEQIHDGSYLASPGIEELGFDMLE